MARPSEGKTKVAVLRAALGITARDFAALLGRSYHTIQSLESGRLKLGDKLAKTISRVTDVSLDWLTDENETGPPVDRTGSRLTHSGFMLYMVRQSGDKFPDPFNPNILFHMLKSLLEKAERLPNYETIFKRVRAFLEELEREIKASESSQSRP